MQIVGHEYPAVVEFAPNQKIPKKSRSRKDAKSGTIDQDSDFLKFTEALQNPAKSTRTIQQCLEDIDAKEKEQKSSYIIYIAWYLIGYHPSTRFPDPSPI